MLAENNGNGIRWLSVGSESSSKEAEEGSPAQPDSLGCGEGSGDNIIDSCDAAADEATGDAEYIGTAQGEQTRELSEGNKSLASLISTLNE